MANEFKNILSFITWLTGIIVSLAIGFAMINKYIIIPHIPIIVLIVAGWFVIVTTLISIALVFVKKK